MQTFKYIVKRILLSAFILFGVSVIIYLLARMMPTNFIDLQYQVALSQGTMTQADVDRIKEIYGLSMPDAYLYVTPEREAPMQVRVSRKRLRRKTNTTSVYIR